MNTLQTMLASVTVITGLSGTVQQARAQPYERPQPVNQFGYTRSDWTVMQRIMRRMYAKDKVETPAPVAMETTPTKRPHTAQKNSQDAGSYSTTKESTEIPSTHYDHEPRAAAFARRQEYASLLSPRNHENRRVYAQSSQHRRMYSQRPRDSA